MKLHGIPFAACMVPMAVKGICKCCGGILMCDFNSYSLHLLKRWSDNMWKLATSSYLYFNQMCKLNPSVVWWSEFLASDAEVQVRFSVLPDFQRSSGSGTGSAQPCEYN
jgi:hypothetical protein